MSREGEHLEVIGPYIVAETVIHGHDIDACRSTRLMELHRKRTLRSPREANVVLPNRSLTNASCTIGQAWSLTALHSAGTPLTLLGMCSSNQDTTRAA